MSITQEQIDNIIKNLSKLPNNGQQGNVEKIIEHMEILSEVDTTWVEPTVSVAQYEARLREDVETRFTLPAEVLACSDQDVIANQIAIPNIMS